MTIGEGRINHLEWNRVSHRHSDVTYIVSTSISMRDAEKSCWAIGRLSLLYLKTRSTLHIPSRWSGYVLLICVCSMLDPIFRICRSAAVPSIV